MTTNSPAQLARLLGYTDEARPGLLVRNYLRSKYPEHEKNERWELDESQAADVIANVPPRRATGAAGEISTNSPGALFVKSRSAVEIGGGGSRMPRRHSIRFESEKPVTGGASPVSN